jgi:hypothetical protein
MKHTHGEFSLLILPIYFLHEDILSGGHVEMSWTIISRFSTERINDTVTYMSM